MDRGKALRKDTNHCSEHISGTFREQTQNRIWCIKTVKLNVPVKFPEHKVEINGESDFQNMSYKIVDSIWFSKYH